MYINIKQNFSAWLHGASRVSALSLQRTNWHAHIESLICGADYTDNMLNILSLG